MAYIELKTLLFDVEASLWLSEPRYLILLSFCTQSLWFWSVEMSIFSLYLLVHFFETF